MDEEESNLEGEADEEENFYIPNSVPRAYNKLHLPSASRESESSQKNKNKKELNKESNSSLTNSNISFHSKNSKKQSNNKNNIVDYNDISNSSNNKKNSNINTNSSKKNIIKKIENKSSTNKKDKSLTGNKSNKSNRSKQSQKSQRKTEENDESLSDISKSSVYTNPHEKSVKSSASKKSEASKKNKSFTNSEKNSSDKKEKLIKKYNYKDLINIEIPMTDEEIKNEIKKELKRLYGTKANQYYDKNFLELILENIKLARKTILKLETGVEPDDNFSKEFMLKYQKEIQKILKYYIEQKKKKNAIMSIGQNIKFIKKLKEAELKDVLNDIENKKKEREIQNEEELNQIMLYPSYCYELQKQIYIAETQNQIDLNNAIEEEKKKSIDEADKNYNNNIAIIYELLRRKEEKE